MTDLGTASAAPATPVHGGEGVAIDGKVQRGRLVFMAPTGCPIHGLTVCTHGSGVVLAQEEIIGHAAKVEKALIAVAHSLPVIIYHLLQRGEAYRELGGDYFAQIDSRRAEGYHIKRLTALGYQVTLTPLPDAAPIPA